ncbi:hypothetical protein VPNG_03169 [Cytospora leucostoma]|uniref:Uncharacterized protein n=1 Tax=Cytospora leucostoma TaxID=1230097 RepID=A0A423XES4_9PEZI|nr:hypothetical protein VPNG_03169 [Cytospora leucostoma]
MCRFEYKRFGACGDSTIEVHEICGQALWKAGRKGELQICIPTLLERSLEWSGPDDYEPPKAVVFTGYEGFCDACEEEYMIPHRIPERSYSDHKLDYSKPCNEFNPHSPAPHLLVRAVAATTIPHLLGIEDQFETATLEEGPYVCFPKRVQKGSWAELRQSMPFVTKGILIESLFLTMNEAELRQRMPLETKGTLMENLSLTINKALVRLGLTQGITNPDRDQISDAVRLGRNPRLLYNARFKPRGMPLGTFNCLVNSIRTEDVVMRAKRREIRRSAPRHCPDFSGSSTLSSLSNTPDLPDSSALPPPPPPSLARASLAHEPQLQNKTESEKTPDTIKRCNQVPQLQNSPEVETTPDSIRRCNQAKAVRLAQEAIALLHANSDTASNPRQETSRASAPMLRTQGLISYMSREEEPHYNLYDPRRLSSVGAQPERPISAKRLKNDEVTYSTKQGRRPAIVPHVQDDDKPDDLPIPRPRDTARMLEDVGSDRTQAFQSYSHGQFAQEAQHPPPGPEQHVWERSHRAFITQQQINRAMMNRREIHFRDDLQCRGNQQSHGTQQFATYQAPQETEQYDHRRTLELFASQQLVNPMMLQHHSCQHPQGIRRSYGRQPPQGIQQASGSRTIPPHNLQWQTAQKLYDASQATQQALRVPASSNAPRYLSQTSDQSLRPVITTSRSQQQQVHASPQYPQTPSRSQQPAHSRAVDMQQVARGLSRPPRPASLSSQGPRLLADRRPPLAELSSQPSQGAQRHRVRGLREIPLPLARQQVAISLSDFSDDGDEDEDVQDSTPEAWEKSRASRKRGAHQIS